MRGANRKAGFKYIESDSNKLCRYRTETFFKRKKIEGNKKQNQMARGQGNEIWKKSREGGKIGRTDDFRRRRKKKNDSVRG